MPGQSQSPREILLPENLLDSIPSLFFLCFVHCVWKSYLGNADLFTENKRKTKQQKKKMRRPSNNNA